MAICESCGKWKAVHNHSGYDLCADCFDTYMNAPESNQKWELSPVDFLQKPKKFKDSILGGIFNFGAVIEKKEEKPKQSYWPF